MRVVLSHLIIVALLVLVVVLLLVPSHVEGKRHLMSDSFSAPEGSAPDINKWEVVKNPANGVEVRDGALLTFADSTGVAYARMTRAFSSDNISLSVEFSIQNLSGQSFKIDFITEDYFDSDILLTVSYSNSGWGYTRMWQSQLDVYHTYVNLPEVGEWYVAELNITNRKADFKVSERDTGNLKWYFYNLDLDYMSDMNRIRLGVDAQPTGSSPKTLWDNFTLYDPFSPPNVKPGWVNLPTIRAVEDEVLTSDLSAYIEDDQELWELTITSSSDYVVSILDLRVSFLFPNNVTSTNVQLILDDGYYTESTWVLCRVTPVNDPPEHAIPPMLTAQEGNSTIVDLKPYIWDVDDYKSSLWLSVTSPYVTVQDLIIIVNFPEGLTEYSFDLAISDGKDVTTVSVYFVITPINNPPTISNIEDILLYEDVAYFLDLVVYVRDPDDDLEDLTITVSTTNADFIGTYLVLLYTEGGVIEVVTLQVTDGFGTARETFMVRVGEVNDPPKVQPIPTVNVTEGEMFILDLGPYISDEESDDLHLILRCIHPNVFLIDGLNLSLMYDHWEDDHEIEFNVSDEWNRTTSFFPVHVLDVNDMPTISSVGPLRAPYIIRIPEGVERSFLISAEDDDDIDLRFSVDTTWEGIMIVNGLLRVTGLPGSHGTHVGYINVFDRNQGSDQVKITVIVTTWSQMPLGVTITDPWNYTQYLPGEAVGFGVRIDDPDRYLYGTVTVTWSSDIVGELSGAIGPATGELTTNELTEGRHIITVTVTDGVITLHDWIVVDVGDVSSGSSTEEETFGSWLVVMIIIVLLVIVVGIMLSMARRVKATDIHIPSAPLDATLKETKEDRQARIEDRRRTEDLLHEQVKMEEAAREARIRREQESEDKRKAKMERGFHKVPEPPRPPEPPTAPPSAVVQGPMPSARRARPPPVEAREPGGVDMDVNAETLMSAIELLPGRLPSDLSLYGPSTIANRIVKGRKKWSPEGRMLGFVQGDWYYIHPNDPDFMERFSE